MAASGRSRAWTTILYEESVKKGFIDILKEFHVQFLLSPLHNQDVDKDGVLKKAHWHLILYFDSLKSKDQAELLFTLIGGVGCAKVESFHTYSRYLCHMDDPDKAQYNKSDVISYGLDYNECIETPDTKYELIGDLVDYITETQIYNFAHLMIALHQDKSPLFKICCDNAYLVRNFLKDYAAMHGKE